MHISELSFSPGCLLHLKQSRLFVLAPRGGWHVLNTGYYVVVASCYHPPTTTAPHRGNRIMLTDGSGTFETFLEDYMEMWNSSEGTPHDWWEVLGQAT